MTDQAPPQADADIEIDQLSRLVGLERAQDGAIKVSVIARLTKGGAAELNAAGFPVGARIGDIVTVETAVDRLPELASLTSVRNMEASVYRRPLNDRARQATGVDNLSGQRAVTQTGHGVVIGIIDTGIDFRHLDFTKPGSNGQQTRIKALLDMTVYGPQTPDPGWNYSLPGQTASIGRLYTEADINAALQAPKPADQSTDSVKERDKNGHGTHVTGTAAGNGLASPKSGTYAGMAPEADLIVVKASRQNDGTDVFRMSDIINALQFVQQKASELGEPYVINLSLGGQAGPHDGTDPDEQAIDNLVNSGPGRAVCVGAGNDGDRDMHAGGNVPAGAEFDLKLDARDLSAPGNTVISPGALDLYYSGSDQISVTVVRPDGVSIGPVAFNNSNTNDQYVKIHNVIKPQNGQHNISLIFDDSARTLRDAGSGTSATWTIKLNGDSVPSGGHFDAWVAEGQFTGDSVDPGKRITSPGTARGAITVGAYVTRSNTLVVGNFTPYTGQGPTADGRQKPEVEAPGHYLYSSRSSDVADASFGIIGSGPDAPSDGTHYTGLSGTSMATAVATGGVALMLQAIPSLTANQIRDSITNTTNPDSYAVPGAWNPRAGFGQLSIAGAINLGGRPTYSISGHVTNGKSGFTLVTLTGTRSYTTGLDSNGNYSFSRLPAGGTYTVTPSRGGPYQYTYTPPSQTFTNLGSNQVADFTETLVAYSIGGRVMDANGNGIGGVQIVLNTGSSGSAQTDTGGNYSFPNLAAGQSYSVEPIPTNKYTFTPQRVSVANLGGNQTVNFTAVYRPLYNITGRINDRKGAGVSGVSVDATGPTDSRSATTDGNGNFILCCLPGGVNYTVKPPEMADVYDRSTDTHTHYVFDPPALSFNNLSGDATANFTAIPSHYIGGRVTDASGTGLGGVTMALSGPKAATAKTSSNGLYTFIYLPEGGPYTVTVAMPGFTANPVSRTFNNFTANISTADFVMTSLPNVIDDARTFVTQHYHDFLNRDPDRNGLDYWTNQITLCGSDASCILRRRVAVSAAYFTSDEFQQTGYYVYRFYKASLGHQPKFNEFMADRSQVIGGATLDIGKALFADQWVKRADFLQLYSAGMSNTDYVTQLYTRAQLDSHTTERQQAMADLNNGSKTRAQVLREMIEIPEYKAREYNAAFVMMQYFGYLRRDYDQDGYNFWLGVMNGLDASAFKGMTCAFITSAEYQLRFSTNVTHTNRDCGQ